MNSSGQTNMWSSTASRNLGGGPVQRNQSTPLSSQNTQDELFTPTSSRQGGFRFGNQNNSAVASQAQSNPVDDFPPLNRNTNGEIGGERGSNLMPSLGFGNQASTSPAAIGPSRGAGNGLLNALSANSRTSDGRSPSVVAVQGTDHALTTRSTQLTLNRPAEITGSICRRGKQTEGRLPHRPSW